ncbi:MAG: FtsX-like permease family protein, partial [Candidatus Acidiferrales bacterium]
LQGREDIQANWIRVVGVVNTVRYASLDVDPSLPQMYFPLAQNVDSAPTLFVRTQGDPLALARPVAQAVQDIDPNQPVFDVRTMQEVIDDSVAPRRMNTVLLTFFSLLALSLASVGIYGVISYSVARRTSEIGIRMALGARPATILRMVLREGMAMALVGIVLGGAASLVVTRFLEQFLFRVDARDPLTFAGVTLVLVLVALLACYLPARRATRVDPMTALRYE